MSLDTSTKVERLLKSLGNNWATVRDKLVQYDCKGTHGAFKCPVSRFLTSRMKVDYVTVCSTDCRVGGVNGRYRLPDSVAEFIKRFDDNEIPELVQQ